MTLLKINTERLLDALLINFLGGFAVDS